ncbi:PREDICTED: uncharacterized protein LOC108563195 [Nicrophorus vespilloides]|uniref:Uncharacterized protein LOC108563195 n=1 Tax=Nicrophorus vespilloides TaxID=110193 RepID=A0ABM1MRU3_NICVS|nr:PREDICTED: uncharacterized protein LOC108563195 [Nicrophorus vespilloides]
MLFSITLIIVVSFLIIYKYLYKPLLYWKERDVIYGKNAVPIFGNLWKATFGKVTFIDNFIDHYKEFPNESFNGIHNFVMPSLVIRDLDIIKQVLVADFDHFTDHKHQPNTADVNPLFSKNLLQLNGDDWKQMRATLSPAFTRSKMKAMFLLISDCAQQLTRHFDNGDLQEIDIRDVSSRFANDVIATCAFGVQCDSIKEKENAFYTTGKEASNYTTIRLVKFMLFSAFPKLFKFFGIELVDKAISSFFINTIKEGLKYRIDNDVVRPDMIHLLMEARKGLLKHEDSNEGLVDDGFAVIQESDIGKKEVVQRYISDEEIAAQAFVFFIAGFETSSVIISFMTLELAIHVDLQEKLHAEIDMVMEDCKGVPTYEAVMKMKYLDMVVSETLRKWPPGPITDRQCTKDITISGNGKSYKVKEGENISIPIIGLQRDEKYFPEPEKFNPERFSDENKSNIIPYTYMPFGLGPRACIGSRFALLEIKVLFIHLLFKYDLVVTEKTSAPIVIEKGSFKMQPEGGFWVGLKPRKLCVFNNSHMTFKMLSYLLGFVVLAFLFYLKFVKPLNYWNDRGVPNVKGIPVFGKQAAVVFGKITVIEWMKRTYKECPGTRYHGSHQFNRPVLVVKDPSLIKQIMVKDFGNFVNRIDVITKDMDPLLGNSLLFLHNQEWKTMRSTLSAAFTGSKMKDITDLMLQLSHNFFKYLSKNGKSRFTVDMKDLSTRYTNDIIASCAYGIECNSLKDKSNDMYKLGKQITGVDSARVLKFFGFNIVPKLMHMMNIKVLPKSVRTKFSNVIKESLAAREKGKIIRSDMIQLLMMAKKGNLKYEENIKNDDTGFATVKEHYTEGSKMLTDNDIVAQALVFFLAGFEPVSTIISFMAMELALNPDIQVKLYEEIERFGDIDYNKILSMRYLDMVVSETLRKWPAAPFLHRRCTVPFLLKAERPDESDLCIGKGDGILIPIIGIQRDEKYFPNQDRFDPERFSDENKDKVDKYTYLPFGTGPRNCIGSRFALLEIKMFFAVALKYFRIEAIEKTASTLELSHNEFPMKPIGGFWVGFSSRNS